jgi:hypothetical protein
MQSSLLGSSDCSDQFSHAGHKKTERPRGKSYGALAQDPSTLAIPPCQGGGKGIASGMGRCLWAQGRFATACARSALRLERAGRRSGTAVKERRGVG